jgi:quinol monooxygenase YgiN
MIVLVVRYRAKPGEMDNVLDSLREMRARILEAEPGCALFHVSRSHDDPDRLVLYEQYVDEAALKAHGETAHFREIVARRVIPHLEERVRELYTLEIE